MSDHIGRLARKYKDKGVLLDTNLLLLFVIGSYRRDIISEFKRTAQYTLADFELVVKILKFFRTKLTTPNILTEVDNLARQLPKNQYAAFSKTLKGIIENTFEKYVSSAEASRSDVYAALGLTDTITHDYPDEILVITDDFELYNRLGSKNRDAININHIREFRS
jgi:hypothetical protein